MVDHLILLSRLSHHFGIKGNALAWFDSYLKSCKQFVQIEGCYSSQCCLAHGIPQGSVLGPLLYLQLPLLILSIFIAGLQIKSPAGAGQIVQSNLFFLGHIPFLAGQTLIIITMNL